MPKRAGGVHHSRHGERISIPSVAESYANSCRPRIASLDTWRKCCEHCTEHETQPIFGTRSSTQLRAQERLPHDHSIDAKSVFDALIKECAGNRQDRRTAVDFAIVRKTLKAQGTHWVQGFVTSCFCLVFDSSRTASSVCAWCLTSTAVSSYGTRRRIGPTMPNRVQASHQAPIPRWGIMRVGHKVDDTLAQLHLH